MVIEKDIAVTCVEKEFKIVMGKGLTSLSYQGQEKFVFRTDEWDTIFAMVTAAKEKLNEKVLSI